MKKILYLLACDIDFTGTPLFVKDLIENLEGEKYDFYVYTPGVVKNNIYTDVHVYEGRIQLTYKITRDFLIKKSLKMLEKQNFDVIHINTSNINIANIYVSYFYKHVEKIICHSHNVITYNNAYLYKKIISYKRNNIVKKSDVLFACSPEAAEAMFGKDIYYVLVNNFIEPNKFKFDPNLRDRCRRGINYSIILGNIGAFNGQKNQMFLLELMKNLDERFALFLIGDGPQKEECIKYCKNNNLENVFFFDSTADVQQYYSCFDIFLLPSKFEGFGRVILEAMVSNLDIITSDFVPVATKFELTHVPLEVDKWKQCILKKVKNLNIRNNTTEVIKKYGYDSNSVIRIVETYYRHNID